MKAISILKHIMTFCGVGLYNDCVEAVAELEALQQRSCDGCGYGKITINSVICGKNGTYKEADDYCKYYNPKEQ